MKCTTLVYRELRGKKKPKWKILSCVNEESFNDGKIVLPYPREKYEVCSGKIGIDLSIDSGYGCSCCSSYDLDVSFGCDTCCQIVKKSELPYDISSLESFINLLLDKVE